jgi:hypothetical protein
VKKMLAKPMAFFKAGAWILTLAGFAHAGVAVFDVFLKGGFSPVSPEAITKLKNTDIGIVDFMKGRGTSVIGGSAWGGYIGFAIAVGILTGFAGLILLVSLKNENASQRCRGLLRVALAMSAVMTAVAVIFYFYFPTILLGASLLCFILALIAGRKEGKNAA